MAKGHKGTYEVTGKLVVNYTVTVPARSPEDAGDAAETFVTERLLEARSADLEFAFDPQEAETLEAKLVEEEV